MPDELFQRLSRMRFRVYVFHGYWAIRTQVWIPMNQNRYQEMLWRFGLLFGLISRLYEYETTCYAVVRTFQDTLVPIGASLLAWALPSTWALCRVFYIDSTLRWRERQTKTESWPVRLLYRKQSSSLIIKCLPNRFPSISTYKFGFWY